MLENFFNKDLLNKLYQTTIGHSYIQILIIEAIGNIAAAARAATYNGCYNIQVNLKQEYLKKRNDFFSPDEFSRFKILIGKELKDRKFDFYQVDDDIINISWY